MHEFIDKEPVDSSGRTAITAVIDADSIAYIIGWEHRDSENLEDVLRVVDGFISQMLVQLQARQYAGFLSPKITFRNKACSTYKANRKEPHPGIQKWKPVINAYLQDKWGFAEWSGYEADDAVAVLGSQLVNSVMCSPDKDMKQVSGNHFDYKKGIRSYINPEESDYNFYHQLLTGDTGDNIPGCKGIGPVTAHKILQTKNGDSLADLVLKTYSHVWNTHENPFLGCDQMKLQRKLIALMHRQDYACDALILLSSYLHTFDLDAAGTSSYLSESDKTRAANDLFSDWG